MAQNSSIVCSRCGMLVPQGQHFCQNCGTPVSNEGNKPTARSGETPADLSNMATRMSPQSPPDGPSYTQYPSQSQSSQTPPPPPFQEQASYQSAPTPVPVYAEPQKNNSGKVWRGVGCGVGVVVLIALVICGSLGYFAYNAAKNTLSNVSKTATATGGYAGGASGGGTTPGATATQAPATTVPLGTTITYSSVDMTLVNVQQAQSFADDTSSYSATTGIVRINLKEQNTTKNGASYAYSTILRLQLPDGSKVEPLNEQNSTGLAASISRTNWIDFPVSTSIKPEQLTLILGTADQAQMMVPLTSNADLSKYKAKTTQPNKTAQYSGLNWTMTSATASWSCQAVQATTGMMYVTVSLKVDNPSSNEFIANSSSYMRLKAGSTTSSPENITDFPNSFASGSSGKTGDVAFLVPQGTTSFTLVFLSSSDQKVNQATIDFQVS